MPLSAPSGRSAPTPLRLRGFSRDQGDSQRRL